MAFYTSASPSGDKAFPSRHERLELRASGRFSYSTQKTKNEAAPDMLASGRYGNWKIPCLRPNQVKLVEPTDGFSFGSLRPIPKMGASVDGVRLTREGEKMVRKDGPGSPPCAHGCSKVASE